MWTLLCTVLKLRSADVFESKEQKKLVFDINILNNGQREIFCYHLLTLRMFCTCVIHLWTTKGEFLKNIPKADFLYVMKVIDEFFPVSIFPAMEVYWYHQLCGLVYFLKSVFLL